MVRITGTHLPQRALVADRLLIGRQRARFETPGERRWVARRNTLVVEEHLREQEIVRELHEFWESQPVPDIEEIRRL